MKKIREDELKNIQINILSAIHSFCVEHNLRYSLAFGSLLGAIRHKGFIPWDDDIDIMLPRVDYEYFIKNFKTESFSIVNIWMQNEYHLPFSKVYQNDTILKECGDVNSSYGVYVDVFPVDNVPNNWCERMFFFAQKRILNIVHIIKLVMIDSRRSYMKNFALKVGKAVFYKLRVAELAKYMDTISQKYNDQTTSHMAILVPNDSKADWIHESRIFNEYIEIPFEDIIVKSIKDYDSILTILYGDYNTLPPEEKRISHHEFDAYWKS